MTKRLLITLFLAFQVVSVFGDDLAKQFTSPPATARPWVYWFWNNGNVTKEGITADLEAMQRVGVGGVIIMDVVERFAPPPGDADFMSVKWVDLFCFAVAEAHRLGIEINMTNGPGWCGSSGPWVTPEFSMQMLVSTNVVVEGPIHYSSLLPKSGKGSKTEHDVFNSTVEYADYYQDIAVLAIPQTTNGAVESSAVVDLTKKMQADGKLDWQVPAGKWTIQRIGHTSTGSSTRPPVKGGNGLECDKLSRAAMDVHFTNMMGKLISLVGASAGPTLSATHIDSWEVGSQNWTPLLQKEFQKRRGYDLTPFLLNETGFKVGNAATITRFQWDFQQTISELLAENYVGRLAELSHEHGMRLSLEGYNLPFGDEALYTDGADEPMSEFWTDGGNETEAKGREMASVGHIMGKKIIGAEAFTSGDQELWKKTPASIKALGDYEFSQGINRFVIHRYAHQPYLDRFPGATMGPWGLHYERTQTWWEMSGVWHQYLSRCQYMLRQGLFVADLCYLRPELPNQTYFTPSPEVPAGYRYDECSSQALIARMRVKAGRLVLPDGMSYGLLILPAKSTLMTPGLVRKIKQLVEQGATVVGPRPTASPSLSDFPKCDQEVAGIAAQVWGGCDGAQITEHKFGKGRVIWGRPLNAILEETKKPADFSATARLNWIHRNVGDKQVYFVANPTDLAVEAKCNFRVKGLKPELWNPETGAMSAVAIYENSGEAISIPLRFEGSGSVFVVFTTPDKQLEPMASFTRNGEPVFASTTMPVIRIEKAIYGVPGDSVRTRDVRNKLQLIADRGDVDFNVGKMADGDDPAFGIVKTLKVDYTVNGKTFAVSGRDTATINLFSPVSSPRRAAEVRSDEAGHMSLVVIQAGRYELKSASGKVHRAEISQIPAPVELVGSWDVHFTPKWGAPEQVVFEKLSSWSESTNAGVRFFSGTATYTKSFDWNAKTSQETETWLDLGEIQAMAQVKLNGQDLGTLWKPPFRVNITKSLIAGANTLEVKVANLWPNRMIGDSALPQKERLTWSSFEPFKKETPLLKSGLLGPVMIEREQVVGL